MTSAAISLGSNLGDRSALLRQALDALARLPLSRMEAVSAFYDTAPFDCPPDSPQYLNAACLLQTSLPAPVLLQKMQQIETALGRIRPFRHAPRTVDLDLLTYGQQIIMTPELTLPHPELAMRAFVLVPLSQISPDLVVPGLNQTVSALLSKLPAAAINEVIPYACAG